MNFPEIIIKGDLIPSGEFKVHSKFNKIVNFINDKSEILALSNELSFLAPNTLIAKNVDFKNTEILISNTKSIKFNRKSFYFGKEEIYNSSICMDGGVLGTITLKGNFLSSFMNILFCFPFFGA